MAREKKIVDITKDDEKSNERYGKDSSGKIIKLEDKGNPKKSRCTNNNPSGLSKQIQTSGQNRRKRIP